MMWDGEIFRVPLDSAKAIATVRAQVKRKVWKWVAITFAAPSVFFLYLFALSVWVADLPSIPSWTVTFPLHATFGIIGMSMASLFEWGRKMYKLRNDRKLVCGWNVEIGTFAVHSKIRDWSEQTLGYVPTLFTEDSGFASVLAFKKESDVVVYTMMFGGEEA